MKWSGTFLIWPRESVGNRWNACDAQSTIWQELRAYERVFKIKKIPSRLLTNLESNEFDVLWIKITIKFFCIIYLPPKDPKYEQFFDYLPDCHSNIVKEFPSSEISLLGEFKVHDKNWLTFSGQNSPAGSVAEIFSTACELTQIINGPKRVPDKANEKSNLPDIFFPQGKTTEPMDSTKVTYCSIQLGWILARDGFAKNTMGSRPEAKKGHFFI